MGAYVKDLQAWSASRDEEGYRNYKARWRVLTTSEKDGPAVVMNAAGLPAIGSYWAFGNDLDPWSFCTPELEVQPLYDDEICQHWDVTTSFTNKPRKRCQDSSIDDPLNEPPDISGSFLKYTREAFEDSSGNLLLNSAMELVRGSAVERDDNYPTVSIKINSPVIGLATFASMVDTVNDSTLWGLSARKIKLENVSWSRKLYGTCSFYYVINYEFKINFKTFDKRIIDEGSRTLLPGGAANNQSHFKKNKDASGENVRILLNGAGGALAAGAAPYVFTKRLYPESNMLILGVPTTLA